MDFNPDFEELEQILGSAESVKENVPVLSPQISNIDNNEEVLSFDLTMDHVFRHAKELKTATHGGYIDGKITLPKRVCENGILKLSPHPSSRSQQFLQPNLLHVTIMNSTKKSLWKSELTERDWQVLVRIRQGEAFLLAWNGSTYDEKPICSLQNGNELPLGGDGLLLTTIIPLQNRKRGELDGVRIVDVIENRLKSEGAKYDRHGAQDPQDIMAQFINKKANTCAKIELHRCRIEAEFMDENWVMVCPPILSQDINNSRHNDVGALELHDMSDPKSSCTKGGFKVLLSSEFKAPTLKTKSDTVPIRAVFVIERNDMVILADKIYSEFQQIRLDQNNFQVHQNTITFRVPPQTQSVLKHISRNQDILKIALYRPHDERFSKTKFRFDYIDHVVGECNFCAILDPLASEGPRKSVRARRDHRRRTTNSGDASIYSASPGMHSPSSGIYSPSSGIHSPSGSSMDDWSPIPKRQRQHSGSAEEAEIMPQVDPQQFMDPQFQTTLSQSQEPDFKTDQETEDILAMIPQDLYDLVPSLSSTNSNGEADSLARLISSTIDTNMESVERYFDRSFDCQDCGGENQRISEKDKGFNSIDLPTEEDFERFESKTNVSEDHLVHAMENLAIPNDQGCSTTQKKRHGFGWLNMALPVLASISLGLYMMEHGLQWI